MPTPVQLDRKVAERKCQIGDAVTTRVGKSFRNVGWHQYGQVDTFDNRRQTRIARPECTPVANHLEILQPTTGGISPRQKSADSTAQCQSMPVLPVMQR